MNLKDWLEKAGFPGDGGSEHELGQMNGQVQSESSAASRDGTDLEATTGKADSPIVEGMHEGKHGKESDDDTGMSDVLSPTSRTEGPFAPSPQGSNYVRPESDNSTAMSKGGDMLCKSCGKSMVKKGGGYVCKSCGTAAMDLEKGGEGSRGGQIIGHTRSGKPIYAKGHGTKDYTPHDHDDAAVVHRRRASDHGDEKSKLGPYKVQSADAADKWEHHDHKNRHHEALAQKHKDAASAGGVDNVGNAYPEGHAKHNPNLGPAPEGKPKHAPFEKAESAPPVESDPDEEDPNKEPPEGDDDGDEAGPSDDDVEKSFLESYDGLVTDQYLQKAGPYIGARGGKWADPEHKIPWNEKKHANKPSPTAKKHDPEGSRELELYATNDGDLHRQQHEPIRDNLSRKMASGKYDHAQATKLYGYLADNASKKYAKEMGSGSGHAFDPATRMAMAKRMADQFHEEAMSGDHDHRVPKKYKGKGLKELHGGSMEKSAPNEEIDMSKLNALDDWLQKSPLNEDGAISPATKGKESPKGSGPTNASTRGSDSSSGVKNLKADERLSELEGDTKEQGVKGAAGGNRGGGAGGDGAMGTNRETSDLNGKRKLAKSLEAFLGREPTWEEMEKAMSGGLTTGDRKDMDERDGGASATAEVGRPEDGGKVAGVGKGSGTPPQGGGSAGLEAKGQKSGDAYGHNQGGKDVPDGAGSNGKKERLSEDDPKDTDEMKSNGMVSKPESKTGGPLGAEREGDPLNKGWNDQQRYPSDTEQLEVNRQHAARVSLIKSGDGDLTIRAASPQHSQDPEVEQIAVMVKGGVLYTDHTDKAAAELAKGGDFYEGGTAPSVGMDARGSLRKAIGCPHCGGATAAYLSTCQHCGNEVLEKAEGPAIIHHSPTQGPGLRPQVQADLVMPPGGFTLDD